MKETKENILSIHNKFLNKKVVITDYDGKKYTGIYKFYYDNDFSDKVEFILSLDKYSNISIPVEEVKLIELVGEN